MPSDYVMNRIVKGATVKTTDEYESRCNSLFGKCEPITEAIIIDIDPISQVTTLRLPNGKTRDINAFWLQLA
jgi:hypothetical protein